MKKLIALLTLIIIIGAFVMGCGNNDKNTVSNDNVKVNHDEEKRVEEIQVEEEEEEVKEDIKNNEEHTDDTQKDIQNTQTSGDAEEVLLGFFEALTNQDLEKAREYILYDNLGFPFVSLEDAADYYNENKPLDIVRVEEIADDMKMIYVNLKNSENVVEESFLLKRLDDRWY